MGSIFSSFLKSNGALLFYLCLCTVCCTPEVPSEKTETILKSGQPAPIFPDYADNIHIPCNIAPLNFVLPDSVRQAWVEISSSDFKKTIKTRQKVAFPVKLWKKLTARAAHGQTDTVQLRIFLRGKTGAIVQYAPIHWIVCSDSIDAYLSYRLVQPTAGAYHVLELRQRCLENFDEQVLISNRAMNQNCFNCHTYQDGWAEKMLVHLRKPSEGSLLFLNGKTLKIRLPDEGTALRHLPDSLRMPLNLVYAAWHPRQNYVALSTNILGLSGYTAHRQYVNLFDSASNILLYHLPDGQTAQEEAGFITLPAALWTSAYEETWPAWSPDGKWLYFCRAPKSSRELVNRYPSWGERVMHTYFDLCRIAFDPKTGLFADTVQVLLKADTTKSYSVPRVHPDGKHVLLCCGLFNSVPYHSSGNLLLIEPDRLQTDTNPAQILNSQECESWHEWSANGRWVVFSSKRQDGIYATPYIAYFNGRNFERPFVLPQKSCRFYQTNLRSFNLPTFTRNASPVTPQKAASGRQAPALEIGIR